jgi:hypothetical protein
VDDDGMLDGEWEETIDEPEMEFDDMTMDLAAASLTGENDNFAAFNLRWNVVHMLYNEAKL